MFQKAAVSKKVTNELERLRFFQSDLRSDLIRFTFHWNWNEMFLCLRLSLLDAEPGSLRRVRPVLRAAMLTRKNDLNVPILRESKLNAGGDNEAAS